MDLLGKKISSRVGENVHQFKLHQLREMEDLSVTAMAKRLRKSPATISGYESVADPKLSTVQKYVEALGGHLLTIAVIPDADGSLNHYLLRSPADPRRKIPTEIVTGRRTPRETSRETRSELQRLDLQAAE